MFILFILYLLENFWLVTSGDEGKAEKDGYTIPQSNRLTHTNDYLEATTDDHYGNVNKRWKRISEQEFNDKVVSLLYQLGVEDDASELAEMDGGHNDDQDTQDEQQWSMDDHNEHL